MKGWHDSPYECTFCKKPSGRYEVWVDRTTGQGEMSKVHPHTCEKPKKPAKRQKNPASTKKRRKANHVHKKKKIEAIAPKEFN